MSAPRFDDYREIAARWASVATCSPAGGPEHLIKAGDRIGYAANRQIVATRRRGPASTQCAACWLAWCSENAEADLMEGGRTW